MLLIYTQKITNRVRYTCELIFNELLGIEFELTTSENDFTLFIGEKLNYSRQQMEDEPFIFAHELLFEKGINEQTVETGNHLDIPTLFIHEQAHSHLPYDPLAATFYMVSRYEEYLLFGKDQYGRFPASSSIAYRHDFLRKPVVNHWVNQIAGLIKSLYPDFSISERKYRFRPTYDIDIAYSYLEKGLFRNVGGLFKSLQRFDFAAMRQRIKVLLTRRNDPYDTYRWQLDLQKEMGLKPLYFFLLSDYSRFDKNISFESLHFQNLIQSISDYADVGIHPSFFSNRGIQIIQKEIKRLSQIVKREVSKSRQHFLRLSFPETYQNLIDLDIMKDYSMGFPDEVGFRAGIASSFFFYDLHLETKTKLRVVPFMLMDVSLQGYLNLTPKEALLVSKQLIDEVREVKGLMVSIWHNHTLCNEGEWESWRETYREIVTYAMPKN